METLRALVNPITQVPAETELETVLALICATPGGRVAVVSGQKPLGLISAQDILRWQMDATALSCTQARSLIVGRPPVIATQDTPLSLALQQLQEMGASQLLVVDTKGACLGVVTQEVLATAVAFLPEQSSVHPQQQQLERLLANLPVCLYTFSFDATAQPQFECLSPHWCERMFTQCSVEGARRFETLLTQIHAEDAERFKAAIVMIQQTQTRFVWEGRIQDGSNEARWLHLEALPVSTEAGTAVWNGVAYEVTERRNVEDKLRLAAAVFEYTLEGVIITNAQARILAVNPAFTQITGYVEAEVLGKTPALLQSGKQGLGFYRALWRDLRQQGCWQGEVWNRRKNGEVYPEWLMINAVRDQYGNVTHYVGVFFDLSRLKRTEEHLERLAHYDPLTQLPNRLLLKARMIATMAKAQRGGTQLALLFIDLDKFKQINDSLGHAAGDELLQVLAQRLGRRLRAVDTLARLGGDEFIIVLENTRDEESIAQVTRELLQVIGEPVTLGSGHQVQVEASIGISLYPRDGQTTAELMQHADSAMYLAKEQGRNTYRFYSAYLSQAAELRLHTETQLRSALDGQQLSLYYQPLVRVSDGQIIGAEALLRWLHDDGQVIAPPTYFIPIAEESGLINALGAWAIQTACQQVADWHAAGLPLETLTVNLSNRQFTQPDLAQQIAAALATTGLAPGTLELEITESAIMAQGSGAETTVQAVRNLGVRFSIDDFGTGYSSLAYLKRLAISKLKIDKSFIRDIPGDPNATEITATIIAMARALKLEVLAEGVETAEQLNFLRQRHCDSYQGYWFSAPLPPAAFAALLVSSSNRPKPVKRR